MNTRIAGFELVTADSERLARFYVRALGCVWADPVLWCGALPLRLVPAAADARPYPANSGSADRWFQHLAVVTTDIAAAAAQAVAAGATAITREGPQHLPERAGGVSAWKFRDPDGHPLELLQFPSHATPPAWRGRHGLHLGIDHSAISVADVDVSIAYYRDRYGFSTVARQINEGTGQSRLDDLAAARVDVVALRPPGGATPHLELLGYHPPGRPSTTAPGDVAATVIVLETAADAPAGSPSDPDGHRARWQGATWQGATWQGATWQGATWHGAGG